jgi:hypothetical protein
MRVLSDPLTGCSACLAGGARGLPWPPHIHFGESAGGTSEPGVFGPASQDHLGLGYSQAGGSQRANESLQVGAINTGPRQKSSGSWILHLLPAAQELVRGEPSERPAQIRSLAF